MSAAVQRILAARVKDYVDGLVLYREGSINEWTRFFAHAAGVAADQSEHLAGEIADLQAQWLSRFDRPPRTGSAGRRLVATLPSSRSWTLPAHSSWQEASQTSLPAARSPPWKITAFSAV